MGITSWDFVYPPYIRTMNYDACMMICCHPSADSAHELVVSSLPILLPPIAKQVKIREHSFFINAGAVLKKGTMPLMRPLHFSPL